MFPLVDLIVTHATSSAVGFLVLEVDLIAKLLMPLGYKHVCLKQVRTSVTHFFF
jgi:hypothetical protein